MILHRIINVAIYPTCLPPIRLEQILLLRDLSDKDICLLGDFNINYLKRSDQKTKKAIEFARIFGFKQLISSFTHLSGFGGTCIDLIFTNVQYISCYGLLTDVIGDHFPVFLCIKKPRETNLGSAY